MCIFAAMSYTIHLLIKNEGWFRNVERTVWYYANGGTWSDQEGIMVLRMGGSGTSGTLRFKDSSTGNIFLVALGVHNYKRWCDIVPDLKDKDTGMQIHPTYYDDKSPRNGMLWKQLDHIEKTDATGLKIAIVFEVKEGNELYATLTLSK